MDLHDGQVAPEGPHSTANLDYLRAVHEGVLDWYRIADSKAQLILTLNGVLVAFASSSILAGKDATWHGWYRILPWSTALALALAIFFAVDALHSFLGEADLRPAEADALAGDVRAHPQYGWWFGHLATLSRTRAEARSMGVQSSLLSLVPGNPSRVVWRWLKLRPVSTGSFQEALGNALLTFDSESERRALSSQIIILSQNVLSKHRSVNRGWVSSGIGLLLLLASSAVAS
jgi:hypothetical protein